jgi:predicted TPR repeat methyltransferase
MGVGNYQLVAALSKIAPKGEIAITAKLFDIEAERFEKQLLEALRTGPQ